MIWRRTTSGYVGTSPEAYRPLWRDPNGANLFIRCRIRSRTYVNGTLSIDSGWSDWTTSPITPSNGFATSPSGGSVITMTIDIETGGRVCPWQMVVKDTTRILSSGATSDNYTTTDMSPGTVTTFTYSASPGTSKTYTGGTINLPAEGT